MTTTRKAKDANPKGGSELKRKPVSKHKDGARRASESVERVRSDGGSKQRSSAVHSVHNGPRAHSSRRQSGNDPQDRAGHLQSVREDRGQEGGGTDSTGGGGERSLLRFKVEPSFVDRSGKPLWEGATVRFFPLHGSVMRSTVECDHALGRMISVRFPGDPFPTYVDHRQLQLAKGQVAPMPRTATAEPTAKELRRQAKTLGVRNWEEMSKDELVAAIAEADDTEAEAPAPARATKKAGGASKTAKKASKAVKATEEAPEEEEPAPARSGRAKGTAKTTAAARKTTKAAAPAKSAGKRAAPAPANNGSDGPNPFRPNTNLWHFTEALMVGGKRSALVKKLLPKVKYNPRVQDANDFDKEAETDRRLKVIGYILKNQHGWEYEHEGRGPDAFIKATPPA